MRTMDGPHPIDIHVGRKIRSRRTELRLSQSDLADQLGITFQQIQKYERGANRVSASKLWQIGEILDCSLTYFFEGLPDTGNELHVTDNELEKLSLAFSEISDPQLRNAVITLAEQLSYK